MRRNVGKVVRVRNGARGTVTGRQWRSRQMSPVVLALESRTLLSTWYINSANSGPADGLTPDTGFATIQAGIASAALATPSLWKRALATTSRTRSTFLT